ncbi:MAG: DeoR/GlpR family DNA-binding transcription regulator [Pseudomonadota bacterium]
MRPEARRQRIEALVRESGRITVEDLAARLGASRETIRRDLTQLAMQGRLRKFHGGAAAPDIGSEGTFRARLGDHAEEKQRIARRAAALFRPGDSLFIDTGSTTLAFAAALAPIGRLTVVTNSGLIAEAVARAGADNRVFLIGGTFREDGMETLGSVAIDQIARFRPTHVVLTAGAIDATAGIMDYDPEEAAVARAMIAQARSLTVLADATKLGGSAPFAVCALDTVDRLVTDRTPEQALPAAFAAADVEVIVA